IPVPKARFGKIALPEDGPYLHDPCGFCSYHAIPFPSMFITPSGSPSATVYEAGEFQQALHLLDGSDLLATLEKQPDDPGLTDSALVVANLYRELGRFSPAESFYLQALANLAHDPGKDHPEYAGALTELAQLQRRQGRYDRALAQLEQARDVHEAAAVP